MTLLSFLMMSLLWAHGWGWQCLWSGWGIGVGCGLGVAVLLEWGARKKT